MKKLNKMQKFIISALSVFIGVAVIFGLSIKVLQTCAEENSVIIETSTETPDISTDSATDEEVIDGEETSENGFVYDAVGNVYYYVDPYDASHTIKFEILEDEKLKIDMFDSGALLATVYGQYDIQVNKLAVYANNEWMGVFVLYPDGRAIEYVEEEDSGVLDEETEPETDNSAILDEIKDYLDSRKDESGKLNLKMVLTDVKFWIIQAISFLAQTGIGVAILGLINRKNKKDNVLTDAHVERVATAAAKKTAESIVGKSIDVDISAEVNKAVKKELYTISAAMDSLVDGVKNTEMLVAREAVALSHSRILGAAEKAALVEGAKKAEAHAGKVVSTAKIEITAPQEKDFETIMSEIKEKCGNCEAWSGTDCTRNFYTQGCLKDEKNIHYLKFNRGEKK